MDDNDLDSVRHKPDFKDILRAVLKHQMKYLVWLLYALIYTPFTQLLQTRVCFTNAGINTYGAAINKVIKHAIHAYPSFIFLILLFRLYVKEPFPEIMERQNGRLVKTIDISDFIS